MKRILSMILALSFIVIPAFAVNDIELRAIELSANDLVVLRPVNMSSVGAVMTSEEVKIAEEALQKAKEEAARKKAEEEARRKEQERLAYVESQRYSHNVFSITGLSVDQFNKLLAPYALAGNGQALYDMEHTYGVNGIFCMAVANVESSLGGYGPSRYSHNYWGIVGHSWSSDYAGIMGFGNYIKNSGYYNGKSIDSIAYTYCPPTAGQWASNVKMFMNQFWSRV